jgi:hypothetical protein
MDKTLEDLVKEREITGKAASFGVSANTKSVVGVEAHPKLRGIPSGSLLQEELRKHITKEDLAVKETLEPWNEYRIENGITLKIRYTLLNVDLTDLYDSQGSPVYLISGTLQMKLRLPKAFKEKVRVLGMAPKKTKTATS